MSSKLFIFDAFRKYVADGTIDLNTDTIKVALVTSSQASSYDAWAATTSYDIGDIVVPTVDNGHRYRCTVEGDSNGTEPTWPTADGGTVVDDEVTWEEYGGALADNNIWADASTNEVATGDGYTTGGETLGSSAVTYTGDECKWDAGDVTWTALTKTMRYAYLYKVGTANGIVNGLIGYVLLDTTPADVVLNGVDFILTFNASGILVLN
jgi:hypothetical protein